MKHNVIKPGIIALFASTIIIASPANASYMQKCNNLISQWQEASSQPARRAQLDTQIEEQCRCHNKIGGKWKLIKAAVGKDNVCDESMPIDTPPPPGDRPGQHDKGNYGLGNFDKGNFGKDRGGDPRGNYGRGNPE